MQVTDEMVERAIKAYHDTQNGLQWFMRGNNFKETMRAALTAALSDKQAVEPVAWLPADDAPRGAYALIKHRSGQLDLCYKTDNGEPFLETWRYAGTAKRGEQAPWPESYIPVSNLRTSPPLSREGEDSAETISRRVLDALRAADLGDLLRASDEVALPTIARALAATRSGSATSTKGQADA